MAISSVTPKPFLGAQITNPKIYASKIEEILDVVNGLQDGTQSASVNDLTVADDLTVGDDAVITGDLTVSGATSVEAFNFKRQVTDTGGAFATPIVLTAAQSGRVILVDDAAGLDFTLPAIAAAQIGTTFEFLVTVSITSNSFRVTAATGDLLNGAVLLIDDTAVYTAPQGVVVKPDFVNDLIMTMNGTTTGGKVGTKIKFTALTITQWFVEGLACGSGVLATPFS